MYNRYIPGDVAYVPVEAEQEAPPPPHDHAFVSGARAIPTSQGQRPPPCSLKGILPGGIGDTVGGLLKSLNLDKLDSGDILLLLIILFLVLEGDDNWELVITLGILLLMGLGDKDKDKEKDREEVEGLEPC